ncbi:MAG TPA: PIN domain-containing protein [Polyangiaceae bacterium]|nr:PIN domain-containing protein [Polyangiaceae bacterium]
MTFTFDTGMLIALERRKQRATEAFRNIVRRGFLPIVPAVVYVEWWRGRSSIREEILAAVVVEDMPPSLCRAAGEALGAVKGSTIADAIVMASAALRGGGVVYTSDVDDLKQLQRHFPTVLILPV